LAEPEIETNTEREDRPELAGFSDEALLEALCAGQNDALAVLFSRHRGMVFRVGVKVLGDTGEAEDLTQMVFLEVFRRSTEFDQVKGSVKAWIIAIAYSRSINHREYLCRRSFYHSDPFDDGAHSVAGFGDSPATKLERSDLGHRLQKGLAALSECQRKVIHCVCFEGWTLREIATETGESFANVRHRYYRGLKKMRALVSAAEP
jgi:RNA polymerase sigma-70 factor, ECF subfamily